MKMIYSRGILNISTLKLVYIISFLDLFAIGLTFPLFSTHLRSLGASHTFIGVINAIYSGLQVFSGPIIGSWSDINNRKSILKTILLLCGVCYGFLGLTDSLFVIFTLRIILGIIKHIQSICKAVITDLVHAENQTGAFGKAAALGSFGFIIGPLIGGHLSDFKNGFSYVSCLTMMIFLVNAGIATQLPDNVNHEKKEGNNDTNFGLKPSKFSNIFTDLFNMDWKNYWESFLLRFLFGLAMSTYFSNQALYLKERYELSQKHIGYMISFFSTIGMISAFFLDRINYFYKNDKTCFLRLVHFFGLMSVCVLGIYFIPNFYALMLLLVPFSLSCTMLRVVSMELMLRRSAELNKAGSLSGASNSIMSVARFVAPLITGFMGDLFGEQSVILLAVVPAIAGVFASLHLKNKLNVS